MKSRRWVVAALLVVAAIGVALLLFWPKRPAPVVVLHGPLQLPMSFRDWVERCIPAKMSWRLVWKMEERLFGNRKPVLIRAEIVAFHGSPQTRLSNSTLGPPNFSDTNGFCVWLLSSNQVSALHEYFRQAPGIGTLQRPRINTAEGIEASMFIGGTPIPVPGITFSNFPPQVRFGCVARYRHNSSDFLTRVTVSELITKDNPAIETNGYGPNGYTPPTISVLQTNLDTALRLQLPKGNGFFLLDQSHHKPPERNIGVLIDPL